MEYLCIDMIPFNKIIGAGFLRLMQSMNPRFEVASRQYYSDQLDPTYMKLKAALKANILWHIIVARYVIKNSNFYLPATIILPVL